jgi:hypothetical protein
MDPFFYSEEAGGKGLPPLSPAPQIPAQPKPSLRSGRFQLTMPNTSCTIITPASLRSDCCSPSLPNAVRLPSGIDVHLHRNTQTLLIHRVELLKPQSNCREQASITLIDPAGSRSAWWLPKGMDRLSTFLSNPVVKKKRSQLPVGERSAPN